MLIVPILGVNSQLTPVLAVPFTEAVRFTDCPAVREVVAALSEILTGVTGCNIRTVAVALAMGFETLVAVMTTCVSPETDDGAL